MARYQIWDKTSKVITPNMSVFTPQQWLDKYPAGQIPGIDLVIAGGAINGAFCGVYDQMIEMYKSAGCDFSDCKTKQEHLDAIEAFEDERNKPDETYVDPNERIAAALEAQVMMALPEEE